MIIRHGRHIFVEIHEVRKGLWAFISWFCFSGADWLGWQTPMYNVCCNACCAYLCRIALLYLVLLLCCVVLCCVALRCVVLFVVIHQLRCDSFLMPTELLPEDLGQILDDEHILDSLACENSPFLLQHVIIIDQRGLDHISLVPS